MVWYQHFWLLGSSSVFLCQLLGLLCLISLALFDLGLNVSKVSVNGNLLSEIREQKIAQEEICSIYIYLLIWLFSMAFFQLCVFGWLSFSVPALLILDIRVLSMLWHSSSWHSFISRHMSFPGILWQPTCVFTKHLAHREFCNVPDLLEEAEEQPYVTAQTAICLGYEMKVWWSRLSGLSSQSPKQHRLPGVVHQWSPGNWAAEGNWAGSSAWMGVAVSAASLQAL